MAYLAMMTYSETGAEPAAARDALTGAVELNVSWPLGGASDYFLVLNLRRCQVFVKGENDERSYDRRS
jgi:hypothetical protein